MASVLTPEQLSLVQAARQVRQNAHAPYSHFLVGAAVAASSGATYAGCNVENATYGATICAERSAIVRMVAEGERKLVSVAVYTEASELTMPCGICRQVMSEFGDGDVTIVIAGPGSARVVTLAELLPYPFKLLR